MADPKQTPIPTISRDMITLYDHFTHGGMDRRSFMSRLAGLAGSSAAGGNEWPVLHCAVSENRLAA